MRGTSLGAFGSGGLQAASTVLRPAASIPRLASFNTVVGHSTTEVWSDDPVQGIDVVIPLLMGGIQCRVMPLKAPPYTVVLGVLGQWGPTGNVGWGIALRESASGKFITFGCMRNLPTANGVALGRWTDVNTFTAPFGSYGSDLGVNAPVWYRISDDGATRSWAASADGRLWLPHDSEASGTFAAPDQAGIYIVNNANAGTPIWLVVRFFEFTVT